MGAVLTLPGHIRVDDLGRAWIDGTSYKVLDVVVDHLVRGFSPAEIEYQHYHELSLAQIHSALAYYFDHRIDIDEMLRKEVAVVEGGRTGSGESPVVKRLKAEGKLP